MNRFHKGLILFCLLGLLASFAGCSQNEVKPTEPVGKVWFNWFDTVSYVYSYAGDPAERFEELSAGISGIMTEYHQMFDIYHEYSGINNLCTVNRLAGGEPVTVDPRLIDFLLYAQDLHQKTGGEMNILLGPVLKIWHDHRTAASEDPAAATVPHEEVLLDTPIFLCWRSMNRRVLSDSPTPRLPSTWALWARATPPKSRLSGWKGRV